MDFRVGQMTVQTLNPQLKLPGIPEAVRIYHQTRPEKICPGKEVLYLGKISGGPRYGTRGLVKKTLSQRVVVDMGHSGIWHIPYYFLELTTNPVSIF